MIELLSVRLDLNDFLLTYEPDLSSLNLSSSFAVRNGSLCLESASLGVIYFRRLFLPPYALIVMSFSPSKIMLLLFINELVPSYLPSDLWWYCAYECLVGEGFGGSCTYTLFYSDFLVDFFPASLPDICNIGSFFSHT